MTSGLDGVEVLEGRRHDDERGWLHVALGASQLPGSVRFGELYLVCASDEGARRGDHLHRNMDEWFSVVQGRAELQLRDPQTGARRSILLEAEQPRTVRVPAGIAHCLVNAGGAEMIAVAWASAEHDPDDVVPCPTSGDGSV